MDSVPRSPSALALGRLRSADDLLEAVPYLLGFHPRHSLVVVGIGRGRVGVTMRLDLDVNPPAAMAEHVVAALRSACVGEALAVVYSDTWPADRLGYDSRPYADLIAVVGIAADEFGIELLDALLVHAGRRWSYRCANELCCPADGVEIDPAPGVFAAEATVAGLVALPSREHVVALLDPYADRDRLQDLIADEESAVVQAALDGRAGKRERSLKRAIFAAARSADDGAPPLTDAVTARFGVALSDIVMRDSVWMAVDDRRLDGQALWRDLARRLPPPYDAAPLFLLGWAAWRSGNGTVAAIAAERAVDSEPGYTAAHLLLAAVSQGMDPRRLPRLRLPRSA